VKVILSNKGDAPIYEQIKQQIKEQILNQSLEEGEALPSIRGLAKDLRVSVITTSRAYAELEQEGLVRSIQGKGYFVEAVNVDKVQQDFLKEIKENLSIVIKKAKILGFSKGELIEEIQKEWEDESVRSEQNE
jgi:GntR family transcriptional regulator